MSYAELIEEIRSMLREAQVASVSKPWTYKDEDFIPQIRSALRHLRVRGLDTTGELDPDGAFVSEPDEMEGLLVAYFVADRLITGDLLQKLQDGELGVLFKAGSDMIDTKTASRAFEGYGARFRMEFDALLAIAMADAAAVDESVLSSQVVQSDDGEL